MEQEQTGVARCPLCRSDNTRYRRSVPGAQAGITSIVVRCNDCQCTFLASLGAQAPKSPFPD